MATAPMAFTEHPRLLARIAGAFYLIITAFALFAYMHVRSQLIDTGDMARTADNIVANEQLFRIGFTAAVIVTMCNLPLGFSLAFFADEVARVSPFPHPPGDCLWDFLFADFSKRS